MTHRSMSLLDFGSVAVWAEGLAWPCPPRGANPARCKSASCKELAFYTLRKRPRFHGSIEKNSADVMCATSWGESGPGRAHAPPSRLVLVEKEFFFTLGT